MAIHGNLDQYQWIRNAVTKSTSNLSDFMGYSKVCPLWSGAMYWKWSATTSCFRRWSINSYKMLFEVLNSFYGDKESKLPRILRYQVTCFVSRHSVFFHWNLEVLLITFLGKHNEWKKLKLQPRLPSISTRAMWCWAKTTNGNYWNGTGTALVVFHKYIEILKHFNCHGMFRQSYRIPVTVERKKKPWGIR